MRLDLQALDKDDQQTFDLDLDLFLKCYMHEITFPFQNWFELFFQEINWMTLKKAIRSLLFKLDLPSKPVL